MVKISETGQKRIEFANANGLCLVCLQPLGARKPIRQAHPSCYRRIYRGIQTGELKDKDLESKGMIGKRGKSGRKARLPADFKASA